MAAEQRIEGLDAAIATLKGLPDKLRKRALRNALAAGARLVRDAAKAKAPILSANDPAVLKGWRKPGTLRKAITVRTSKAARRAGNVGVFVNVRPAKGAKFKGGKQVKASQRGAKSPNDPFYWRFVEFGTKRATERKFLREGAQQLGRALEVFKAAMGTALAKINANPRANP
ncbi:MAG: hypothetical protein RJA36_3932 [Pseudomonadota bacterium]|jgi:HK97 gp10 family phage protein